MAAQRPLGQALRALRKDKGLTEAQLAEKLGIAQTTLSRYEGGSRLPSAETLEKVLDALSAPKRSKRELLDQLHGAQTQLKSARAIARRGLSSRQGEIARIEARAKEIRNFQAAVVPGLLQTADYARRMFDEVEKVGLGNGPEDLGRALTVRLDRQAILHDRTRHFGFVVTEAVLLWPRGGTAETLAQFDRLLMVAEFPNVDLAILPLASPPPFSPINSFTAFDEDLVLVETVTEQLAVQDPSDVAVYLKLYGVFRKAARAGAAARDLIDAAAARLQL